jgi:hypothetical protein
MERLVDRRILSVAFALIMLSSFANTARAGLFPFLSMDNEFWVPMLHASYDHVESELIVKGKVATFNGRMGGITMADFRLDAKFDLDGQFAPKGSFSISNGTVEFLRGTITEANTAVFASHGKIGFLAGSGVEGSLAPKYKGAVGIEINLARSFSSTGTYGYYFDIYAGLPSFNGASAEIGRPVPEPSSWLAMASTLVIGLSTSRRQRRRAV